MCLAETSWQPLPSYRAYSSTVAPTVKRRLKADYPQTAAINVSAPPTWVNATWLAGQPKPDPLLKVEALSNKGLLTFSVLQKLRNTATSADASQDDLARYGYSVYVALNDSVIDEDQLDNLLIPPLTAPHVTRDYARAFFLADSSDPTLDENITSWLPALGERLLAENPNDCELMWGLTSVPRQTFPLDQKDHLLALANRIIRLQPSKPLGYEALSNVYESYFTSYGKKLDGERMISALEMCQKYETDKQGKAQAEQLISITKQALAAGL